MSNQLGFRGAEIIKDSEALRLTAYKPTPQDVWTCGWGHTRGVTAGTTCTPAQAQEWFNEDTAGAVTSVRFVEQVAPLTPAMFDALVSLIFNVGAAAVREGSTIHAALKKRDYYAACQGFFLWRKQKGRDLLGLARRRVREMALFLEDGLPD